jgi:hypothetical protein
MILFWHQESAGFPTRILPVTIESEKDSSPNSELSQMVTLFFNIS